MGSTRNSASQRRILLWNKLSLYEMFSKRPSDRLRIGPGGWVERAGSAVPEKVRTSHEETLRSRETVRSVLAEFGLPYTEPHRLRRIPDGRFALVVVVGGDGTVLDVARWVGSTPVLAVNSSPSTSVGHFCRTVAGGFREVLAAILAAQETPTPLARIEVVVDGRTHPHPALNDVLVAHRVPAATSRYILHVGSDQEEQKSSGVWVSTAAGGSGAIASAGGERMDLRDTRLQFLVREPFSQSTPGARPYRLLRGFVGPDGVSFTSRMVYGGLYLDGRRVAVPFGYGSFATLRPTAAPLNLYLPPAR